MDSRFHLRASFTIYGEEYVWNTSLNWSSYDSGRIDERITKWFLECHDEARAKWDQKSLAFQEASKAKNIRQEELAELNRLKSKYPDQK